MVIGTVGAWLQAQNEGKHYTFFGELFSWSIKAVTLTNWPIDDNDRIHEKIYFDHLVFGGPSPAVPSRRPRGRQSGIARRSGRWRGGGGARLLFLRPGGGGPSGAQEPPSSLPKVKTEAWPGSAAVAERAVLLVAEGAADDGSVHH